MVSTVLSCKVLDLSLAFVGLFPASLAQTPSAKFSKVCLAFAVHFPPFLMPAVGSVGLVSRFGQFYKSVDPGLVQVNVCTESLRIVDVKIQISPIGRQMVMYVCSIGSRLYFFLLTSAQY